MTYSITVTSQGQISIPAAVRRHLQLDKKPKLNLTVDGQNMILTPQQNILSLMGVFKTKKTCTRAQEREAFEKSIAEDFT